MKRHIGFLPDAPVFYTDLSGREVLELSAEMHGLDLGPAVERARAIAEPLDLGKRRSSASPTTPPAG